MYKEGVKRPRRHIEEDEIWWGKGRSVEGRKGGRERGGVDEEEMWGRTATDK